MKFILISIAVICGLIAVIAAVPWKMACSDLAEHEADPSGTMKSRDDMHGTFIERNRWGTLSTCFIFIGVGCLYLAKYY